MEAVHCAILCVALSSSLLLGYYIRARNEARVLARLFPDDFWEEFVPDIDTMPEEAE